MGCASSSTNVTVIKDTVTVTGGEEHSFFGKYTLGGKLGKGGFAQVRILENTGSAGPLAVKIMDLRQADSTGKLVPNARFRKEAVEEAGAWREAGIHANIVGLRDAFLEHGACFFVMELCNESFQNFLKNASDELNESAYSRIFGELFAGLNHVHGKRVVHRDIKPDNVMVSGGVVKLCDFGLAGVLPLSGGGGLSGIYGTAPFMSPEMLNREIYRTEVDVWSMGVIAYTMFYGDFPYLPKIRNSAEMKKVIREGATLPSFQAKGRSGQKPLPAVSEEAEALVRALLNRNRDSRIDAAGALQFKFILNGPSSEEKLPSLQTTLRACLKCGAFENRPVDKFDSELDPLLDKLHRRHTGRALVQDAVKAPTKADHSSRSDASTVASLGTSSQMTNGSTITPDWKTSNMSTGGCHQASHSLGQPI